MTAVALDLNEQLATWRNQVEQTLARNLPAEDTPPSMIHRAMRYSVMAGGKRLRPLLAIAAAEACDADPARFLVPFAALELIHTYSLVHDDLPALDNDELRRGRPTAHVVFGDAIAILAGDALLTEAFSWLSRPIDGVDPRRQLRAIEVVSTAIDSKGMIGGQVADLEAERIMERSRDETELRKTLEFIHTNKTARLITASVLLGGILAGADEERLRSLEEYGSAVGLAFQIVDDLLDVEQDATTLGKTAGKDEAQGKLTYPALVGREAARHEVDALLAKALATAGMIRGHRNYLPAIARFLCDRRA